MPLEASTNVTEPVGVPAPGLVAVTVAVYVTAVPDFTVLFDVAMAVVVFALLTVWLTSAEVEPR